MKNLTPNQIANSVINNEIINTNPIVIDVDGTLAVNNHLLTSNNRDTVIETLHHVYKLTTREIYALLTGCAYADKEDNKYVVYIGEDEIFTPSKI